VGANDNGTADPAREDSGRANQQGAHRLRRALNMFEAVHDSAVERGIPPGDYEYELFVKEGEAHDFDDPDAATLYEFLFREFDEAASPLRVHSRVVSAPTADERRASLPQGIDHVAPLTDFYLEL
jgi:hypothetical protein